MSAELGRRLRRLAERLASQALPAPLRERLEALLEEAERLPAPRAEVAEALPQGAAAIRLWCDGSCAPNPGPGGWGAILEQDGRRLELSGAAPESTNNIMEMTAAIEALRRTPAGARVLVTTDSRYLMDGITKWMAVWKRKDWRTADRKPVKNQALWRELDELARERQVRWEWVQGHSGHPENERCDELANAARIAQ